MAVLNLLLHHDAHARAVPELAPVIAKHEAWMSGKRFLLVPYHMIGARSMESAILGHYAEHVRKLHPEAPIPGFYQAEGLFRDAGKLRATLGDEAFFAGLDEAEAGATKGWGSLASSWTAETCSATTSGRASVKCRSRSVCRSFDTLVI